jgi:hypothetical protein
MNLAASRADDWFKDGSGVVAVQAELLDIQVGVRTAKNKGAHVSDTWLSGT